MCHSLFNFCVLNGWCVITFGLLLQNAVSWVANKQQRFISHSSVDWEVQDEGTSISHVC